MKVFVNFCPVLCELLTFFLHFSEAAATEILDNAIAVGEASAVDTDKKDEDLNFDEQVNNFQKVSFLYHFIKKIYVFSLIKLDFVRRPQKLKKSPTFFLCLLSKFKINERFFKR